jgi:hypothetical protein
MNEPCWCYHLTPNSLSYQESEEFVSSTKAHKVKIKAINALPQATGGAGCIKKSQGNSSTTPSKDEMSSNNDGAYEEEGSS